MPVDFMYTYPVAVTAMSGEIIGETGETLRERSHKTTGVNEIVRRFNGYLPTESQAFKADGVPAPFPGSRPRAAATVLELFSWRRCLRASLTTWVQPLEDLCRG